MVQKQIEVTIDPLGNIFVEGHGFKGADCQKATAFLEKALGKPGHMIKKKEFNDKAGSVLVHQS